ncbi:ATP-binding protein [Phenylobacterium sp.]|uniref:hybrid sensor histidine kinase/response regulator n=1 Tax=Phenylobacterium sp. TaxID=1871053 RepID=UPI0025DB4595|nr:ATP-binding protein [Phenylobacterium sp.]
MTATDESAPIEGLPSTQPRGDDHLRLQWALEAYVRSTRALMHFESLDGLLSSICEAIVEGDRYPVAAVALTRSASDEPVEIRAFAGRAAGYLEGLELSSSAATVAGSGPTGQAMRSGEPVVMRDALVDPQFAPWRARAAQHGIRSSATIPFKLGGVVRGVLLVYADRPDGFGTRELDLFRELANEMAFGISVADDRQRLAAAARDYKLLADHSSDIIVRYGAEDVVHYVSPAVSQLGYRPQDIVGRTPFHLVHPDDHEQLRQFRLQVGESSGPWELLRLRIRRADGEWRWFEGSPRPIPATDEETAEAVVTLRDVTERRELELELRRRQAEAEAGIRAKSEFLANMSHEIRTPLTAIVGFADLMRQAPGLTPPLLDYANRIAVAGQALQTIVDQILDFSRVDAGRIELDPQPFDPGELVNVVLAMLAEPARAKGLQLSAGDVGRLPKPVVADAGRIRQVLLGLLDNALKFTDEGGVRLSASYDDEQGGTLRFAVTDTGIGIPAGQGEALFESFSQVDGSVTRRHGGTGLGLAIAKSLVERLGGRIGYSSEPQGGSTFWFSIPAPRAPASPAESDAPPGADAPTMRVLVVDDAPVNCELVGAMLSAAGYELTFAHDGQEAVALAAIAPFDLILMDMQMPVMDGPSAARAIRTGEGPNVLTPIVAVSANVLPMHVQACLQAGMDDHIPKPIALHSLLTKVTHWAGRQRAA